MLRTACRAASIVVFAGLALTTASPSFASSTGPKVCKGTFAKPGVLAGELASNVVVRGVCDVDRGPATVKGNLTVSPGSVLVAAFAHDTKTHAGHGDLTVTDNLVVQSGATAIAGCDRTVFACVDDSQTNPTLSNRVTIGGDVVSTGALGTLLHVARVGGSVTQNGGGGGVSCQTMPGIFRAFKSPQYSDYEDDSIAGSLTVTNLDSCWLGAFRDQIGKNVTLLNNQLADPDAIEVGANTIDGNLACEGNTMVWDSAETTALYPRNPNPNEVRGTRSGQCSTSTPLTQGGPYGAPGTF